MYVYIKSESGLWTAGFYKPNGEWAPESDHTSPEEAAQRVNWLNGGSDPRSALLTEACQIFTLAFARGGYIPSLGAPLTDRALRLMRQAGVEPRLYSPKALHEAVMKALQEG